MSSKLYGKNPSDIQRTVRRLEFDPALLNTPRIEYTEAVQRIKLIISTSKLSRLSDESYRLFGELFSEWQNKVLSSLEGGTPADIYGLADQLVQDFNTIYDKKIGGKPKKTVVYDPTEDRRRVLEERKQKPSIVDGSTVADTGITEVKKPEPEVKHPQYHQPISLIHTPEVATTTGENGVKPPVVKLETWLNYELSLLEQDFEFADFARRIDMGHASKIRWAILNNEFVDNLITVFREDGGKNTIVDGQHRITALGLARDENYLKHYDLILRIVDGSAREIYRKLNIGRPLTASDYFKAIDDGTHPFFNELRGHLVHYQTPTRFSFASILLAYYYVRSESHGGKKEDGEKILNVIKQKDIDHIKTFLESSREIFGETIQGNPFYRSVIFRNALKVSMDNGLNKEDVRKLLKLLRKNKRQVFELSTYRTSGYYLKVRKFMKELWKNNDESNLQ